MIRYIRIFYISYALLFFLYTDENHASTLFVNKGLITTKPRHAHLYSYISFEKIMHSKQNFIKLAKTIQEYFFKINIRNKTLNIVLNDTIQTFINLEDKFHDIERVLKVHIEEEDYEKNFLLDKILKLPSNHIPVKDPESFPAKRDKRQALVGLGLTASFALGAFNLYNIHELKQNIQIDQEDQNNINSDLILELKTIDHKFEKISSIIKSVQKSTAKLLINIWKDINTNDSAFEIVQLLRTKSVKLHFEMSLTLHALFELTQNRLSIDLFNNEHLKETFQIIVQKIKQNGFIPVNEQFSSIFNNPFSYESDEKGVNLFIHIPIIPRENMLYLYQYIPLPIFTKDISVTIDPDKKYFIASHDLSRGIELSDRDFNFCKMDSFPKFCPIQILKTDIQFSCLGLLFKQDYEKAIKKCEISLSYAKENIIIYLENNRYAISAQNNETFILSCKGQEHKNIKFNSPKLFTLEKNCKLTGNNFLLENFHTGPIVENNEIIEYPTIDNKILFEPIINKTKEIKAMLNTSINIKRINFHDLKNQIDRKRYNDNQSIASEQWNLNFLFIFLGGFLVIIADMIIIVIVKKFCRKRC